MKRLIVNADDFGLHEQINKGIIKGFRDGFITSASLMWSAPAYKDAVSSAVENPGLGIGIHLTLIGSIEPVLPEKGVKTLLDGNGAFLPDYRVFAKRFYSGKIRKDEVEAEMRAQIERALASELNITHLDSHQHLHVFPGIIDIVIRLCREYKIKAVRIPKEDYLFCGGFNAKKRFVARGGLSFFAARAADRLKGAGILFPDHFFGMLAGGNLNEKLVRNIILSLPDGTSEIMTHPGIENGELARKFDWNYHWEKELEAFLSDENKYLLKQQNVALTDFGGLFGK